MLMGGLLHSTISPWFILTFSRHPILSFILKRHPVAYHHIQLMPRYLYHLSYMSIDLYAFDRHREPPCKGAWRSSLISYGLDCHACLQTSSQ